MLCFCVIGANEESDFGEKISDGFISYVIVNTCTVVYYVLAFPTIILLKLKIDLKGWEFFLGCPIGCLFHAVLFNFLITKYRLTKSEIENPTSEI
jgi:hypothetical protein